MVSGFGQASIQGVAARADSDHCTFSLFMACPGMAGVFLDRRDQAGLFAALSDVRQQLAPYDSRAARRSRLESKHLVAWAPPARGVGRELAQESPLRCKRGALWKEVVADRLWMVCDSRAQSVRACKRCPAGEK